MGEQAAIDAGARALWAHRNRNAREPSSPAPDHIDRMTATVVLEAAAPHIAAEATAAERARLYAELGNEHYVIFTEDRWTVEHSVECRLGGHMHECPEHAAVALIADEFDPGRAGRWRIDGVDGEGLPSLTRAEGQA